MLSSLYRLLARFSIPLLLTSACSVSIGLYGNLAISISGLPSGVAANVQVIGPGNYNTTETASTEPHVVQTGFYTIKANPVTYQGQTFIGTPASQEVFVSANAYITAHVSYSAQTMLQGAIENTNPAAQSFTVLGQPVIAGASTVFENATMATLAVGNVIAVSGDFDSDGNVLASRIEKVSDFTIPTTTAYKIKGTVNNTSPDAQTFRITQLIVDYSHAIVNGQPAAEFSEGMLVMIRSTHAPESGVLLADEIDIMQDDLKADGASVTER